MGVLNQPLQLRECCTGDEAEDEHSKQLEEEVEGNQVLVNSCHAGQASTLNQGCVRSEKIGSRKQVEHSWEVGRNS